MRSKLEATKYRTFSPSVKIRGGMGQQDSSFPHNSTFSACEVSYKNALYKFTVIIIIIISMGDMSEWTEQVQ